MPATRQSQAAFQAALFAVDGLIVVYLSFLMTRARRAAESTGERLRLANEAAGDRQLGPRRGDRTLRCPRRPVVFPGLADGESATLTLWLSLVHPDDRDAFERAYQRSLDPAGDGTMLLESRVVRPDGVVRWISWEGRTSYQQRAGGRTPVRQVGTAIDITERREREDALKALTAEVSRSEARRRDLLELAPDAFFVADLDGRFTDVNQAACRMLGYARDELVGKTILDIIPPEDAPRLAAVKAALLVPGEVNRAEWTQRRKDGTLCARRGELEHPARRSLAGLRPRHHRAQADGGRARGRAPTSFAPWPRPCPRLSGSPAPMVGTPISINSGWRTPACRWKRVTAMVGVSRFIPMTARGPGTPGTGRCRPTVSIPSNAECAAQTASTVGG